MDYLKSATFGGLFAVTFVVAATFQVVMTVLAMVLATLSPGLFQINGAPATSPAQAIGTLLLLLTVGFVVNAGMSAIGALLWLLVRKLVPSTQKVR